LLLAAAGFFLITLDNLIVNVALPQINRELGGGTVGQQWVVDGYTLAFAPLLLFGGNLADRIGAKRTFGLGVALFGLTSVACALAPLERLLDALRPAGLGRVLQAIQRRPVDGCAAQRLQRAVDAADVAQRDSQAQLADALGDQAGAPTPR
jgi:MFS family permease